MSKKEKRFRKAAKKLANLARENATGFNSWQEEFKHYMDKLSMEFYGVVPGE